MQSSKSGDKDRDRSASARLYESRDRNHQENSLKNREKGWNQRIKHPDQSPASPYNLFFAYTGLLTSHTCIWETDVEPLAISIKDTTKVLGVGRTTVYGFINAGRLQTVKLGRRTLISTESIRNLARIATVLSNHE